jgi:hypothetical protein
VFQHLGGRPKELENKKKETIIGKLIEIPAIRNISNQEPEASDMNQQLEEYLVEQTDEAGENQKLPST